MISRRKQYTDEFRANVVLMLEAAGYVDNHSQALRTVSKSQGVPESTLRSWWNRLHNPDGKPNHGTIPAKLYTLKKGDLIGRVKVMAEMLADSVIDNPDVIDEATLRDRVTAFAIAIDKLQLLSDKPTAIVKLQEALESGKITKEQAAERWPALMRQYDHINA